MKLAVARTLYDEIPRKDKLGAKDIRTDSMVEAIATHNKKVDWCNVAVKTSIKCQHNRRDMIIQDTEEKLCTDVEIIDPTDVNIKLNINEKENTCAELQENLQLL